MDNARKDKLKIEFIINKDTNIKELKDLKIQEITYLISSAEYFKKEKAFDLDFDEKIKIFKSELIKKIRKAEMLFILYNYNTSYPYIDEKDRAALFSDKELCLKNAEDIKEKYGINTKIVEINNINFIKEFFELHRMGIKKILMDNGGCDYEIDRDDILPLKEIKYVNDDVSIINDRIMLAGIKYFQLVKGTIKNNLGYGKDFYDLENNLILEIIKGRYLVPVLKDKKHKEKFIEKDEILFGRVKGEDKKDYLAVFTDIQEFKKAFERDKWNIQVLNYEDIKVFCDNNIGFVINCYGLPIFVNDNNKGKIEAVSNAIKEVEKKKEEEEKEKIEKTKTKIMTPKKYPYELIHALKKYMRKQKSINKAYLREVRKNEDVSYLVVLDCSKDVCEIFKDICTLSIPYLHGKNIDVADVNSEFGKKAVINAEAFYKKNFWGYLKKIKKVQ